MGPSKAQTPGGSAGCTQSAADGTSGQRWTIPPDCLGVSVKSEVLRERAEPPMPVLGGRGDTAATTTGS